MFGDNLKKYRTIKGLSQSELAEKLYVSRQCVSKWEKGTTQPDLETLNRISEILEVSTDTLIKENCAETFKPKKADLNRVLFIANILVALFCVLSFITLWRYLPDKIPAHWYNGKIDRYGSSAEIFLHIITTAVFLAVDVLLYFIIRKQQNNKIAIFVHGLLICFQISYLIFVIVLYAKYILYVKYITESSIVTNFTASLILCVSVAMHPKISKQNKWLGVRINETLSNEVVWNKTNALASYTFTVCSFGIIAFGLTVQSIFTFLGFLAYLIPTAISIVYAKHIYAKMN